MGCLVHEGPFGRVRDRDAAEDGTPRVASAITGGVHAVEVSGVEVDVIPEAQVGGMVHGRGDAVHVDRARAHGRRPD